MSKLAKFKIAGVVLSLAVGGSLLYFIYCQVQNGLGGNHLVAKENNGEKFYRQLDGQEVEKDRQNLLPMAVMIENHVDSRPPSGLDKAGVVYEVLAEGEITRFLAIFDLSEIAGKIGPVRSARPYYIDIASEYGAVYAHSGGSPEAIDILKSEKMVHNLDEFPGYNTGYFWRDDAKDGPHNLYTSTNLLLLAKSHYGWRDESDFKSWKFKDGVSQNYSSAEIRINYSVLPEYQAVWKYNPSNNKYERWQNNSRHVTDDGTIIEADNVIIQYAKTQVMDDVGRNKITLTGEGKSVVFRDGLAIVGAWKREGNRTRFYDDNDAEIELNRGKIWVEIVPAYLTAEY